jgi:hypothetical protein
MTGLNEGDLDLCDELRADGENASRRRVHRLVAHLAEKPGLP